jgi:L-iditol 2-dehydrogenase
MKALVKYEAGPRKVKIMEREIPVPVAGQVRVKVCYSGICGTDIHILKDDGGYKTNPPVTLGHEFSGIVDQVGEGVDPGLIGKRVVSETYYITCGNCFYCQTGHKNLCADRKSIGSGVDGAMAEYLVVPAQNLHLIPDRVGLREAALTEPLACCAQAVLEKINIKAGDKILITGPGAIGLMCLQLAVLCGGRVIMAGMKADETRLQLAKNLGAAEVFYSDAENAEAKLKAAFGEFGADIVLECSGAGPAINMALQVIRKGGQYAQVGLTGRPTTLDMNLITLKELSVLGTFAQKTVWWTRSLELVEQGQINLEALISKVMALENWEEAFEFYMKGAGLKYLLTVSPET